MRARKEDNISPNYLTDTTITNGHIPFIPPTENISCSTGKSSIQINKIEMSFIIVKIIEFYRIHMKVYNYTVIIITKIKI